MSKPRILIARALAMTALAALVSVPGHAAGHLGAVDQQFLKSMSEANLAEVETGKLARTNAQSADVKSFGAMMVEDHSKALKKIQSLADDKGVALPAEPNSKHMSAAHALQASTGEAFDRRYASMAVTDHEDTLALLKKVYGTTKDKELRSLSSEMIPVVTKHLSHARQLAAGH